MRLLFIVPLVLLPFGLPELLQEPEYSVSRDGNVWMLNKPGTGGRRPVTISQHPNRGAAELRRRSLPRVRLSRPFVRFDPATCRRTLIVDWTGAEDAREIEVDVRELLDRFAPAAKRALLESTPVYMARLSGESGHTAEEETNSASFVVYLDPFRATGRLHAAATLTHETAHVERYRARGFHANRAASALPKEDFVRTGCVPGGSRSGPIRSGRAGDSGAQGGPRCYPQPRTSMAARADDDGRAGRAC
jgi:hypothetical protein